MVCVSLLMLCYWLLQRECFNSTLRILVLQPNCAGYKLVGDYVFIGEVRFSSLSLSLSQAHGNVTACQLVANLCVLQRYSMTDPACVQSMLLAGNSLPPIYYPPQSADEWLERDDIITTLATIDINGVREIGRPDA